MKASETLEEEGQSSSSRLQDKSPRRLSPLHQMAAGGAHCQQLSPLQKMSFASNGTCPSTVVELDANILSRMVTASGSVGAGVMPNIRVASMHEFRRASMNTLNSVPESSMLKMKAPNQQFADIRRQTIESSSHPTCMATNPVGGPPDNPLLRLMEERMAAKNAAIAANETPSLESAPPTKSTPAAMASMTEEQRSALSASINKWAGLGARVSNTSGLKGSLSTTQLKTVDEMQISRSSPTLGPPSPPNETLRRLLNNNTGSQSRTPLEPSQEILLQELIQSAQPPPSPAPVKNLEDFVAQVLLQQQRQQQAAYAPVSQRGMIRPAVSLAEIDRLRKANQSVQLRQQLAVQERMNQHSLQRRIQPSSGDEGLPFPRSGLPNESSMRKRRSSTNFDDDNTDVSSGTGTPSMASLASSCKVQRSDSHVSVHTSMENLRLHCSRSSGLNMHNQTFSSSGLNSMRNQSFTSGLNHIRNQSLSSGFKGLSVSFDLDKRNQSFSSGSAPQTVGILRASSKTAMKMNTSSSSLIQSMIATQDSAAKAAVVANQLKWQSNSASASPLREEDVAVSIACMTEVMAAPIQVTAEEYPAPPINHAPVIVSDLPDRIKFHNVQIDKKPIDVVKDSLSSRGEEVTIKATMEMPTDFFVQCQEMYVQEAVDAVRSNDVHTLKQLAEAGANFQCGNRFGETLIHLACRRSHRDVVAFLVNEAGVSIKVRDDYGRTPMHDACWRATVDLDLMDMLIDACPELLLLSDKRGHTPLDYARREHWDVIIPFLNERKDKFRSINENL